MAKGEPEWIEPAEALRMLVRGALPERPVVADLITGPAWFLYPKMAAENGVAAHEFEAAKRALGSLHHSTKNGAIQARGIFNGQGLPVSIEPTEFSDGRFDIWSRTLDATVAGHGKRVYLNVVVRRKDVEAVARGDSKGKGGRPPAADWPTIKDLLRHEIKNVRGFPDDENPTWRTQADVEGWVEGLIEGKGQSAAPSTLKHHVRTMLVELKAELGTNVKTRPKTSFRPFPPVSG